MTESFGRSVGVVISVVNSAWLSFWCFLGLRNTSVIGDQLRVLPDQRRGFRRFAFSYTTARWAKISVSSPRCRQPGVTKRIALCKCSVLYHWTKRLTHARA